MRVILREFVDEYLRGCVDAWREHPEQAGTHLQWEDLQAGPNDRHLLPTDLAAMRQMAREASGEAQGAWHWSWGGASLSVMAIAVTAPPAVKIAGNVEGADVTRSVKNTGANPVFLSRDPAVTSASASEFSIAAAATSPLISLAPGEELYAVCGAGLASSVEVI